jgi:hypothetical protein
MPYERFSKDTSMVLQQAYIYLRFCGQSSTPKRLAASYISSSTTRMLQSELINDGRIDTAILDQLCKSIEAGM